MTKAFIQLLISLALFFSSCVYANEAEDAKEAAGKIMRLMSEGKYAVVWDTLMSPLYKSAMTRDSYLANLSFSRQGFGKIIKSRLIDQSLSKMDPGTGYQGSIYAFNFLNEYAGIKVYERIVVINQDNKGFKLAGFWVTPAQE